MEKVAEVYTVTNRSMAHRAEDWRGHFTNEFSMDHDLRFGHYWQTEDGEIDGEVYADGSSADIYQEMQGRMRESKKDCLIFGHGFNNSYEDAVRAAIKLSLEFDVIVIVFTWPSDGVLKYREVKKYRAFSTVPAWDRFIEKYTDNLKTTDPDDFCGQRVSLVAHSMFNHILEMWVLSPMFNSELSIIDNVNLQAADVNNAGHDLWVGRLNPRRNLNVWINENDKALDISDNKFGSLQWVRLGNTARDLVCKNAHYYNLTDRLDRAGSAWSHGYFKDGELLQKAGAFDQVKAAYHGRNISGFKFHPGLNFYS